MSAGLVESAQRFVAHLLELSRTRFELFGVELREELGRLATGLLGGLAVLVLVALGLGFGGFAFVLYVSEANRLAAAIGVALFFFAVAVVVALLVRRVATEKPRAFDATITELRRDLDAINS
jgi:uncharacterized membrane protein YqjE